MILTPNTFKNMIKSLRASYGQNWRSDLDTDREAQLIFFNNCQELIPEEMAGELVTVYRTNREIGPRSPYDLVSVYIEKQLEDAKSSDFVIERLTAAIQKYEYSDTELPFTDCDDYLFKTLIPILPCSDGVKAFYQRNKSTLRHLALYGLDLEEQTSIYKSLGFDYRKQLTNAERKAVIRRIDHTALTDGNEQPNNQLEAVYD